MDKNNEEGIPLMSDIFAVNTKKQTFEVNQNNFPRASQRYEDDDFYDEGIIFIHLFHRNIFLHHLIMN